MAVDWKKLKPASNQMANFMTRAVTGVTEFQPMVETAIGRGGNDKAAWEKAKPDVATLLDKVTVAKKAAEALKGIADKAVIALDGNQPVEANAEKDAAAQWKTASEAADAANGLVSTIMTSLKNVTLTEDEKGKLDSAIIANLNGVVKSDGHRDKAKAALGITEIAPSPPPLPTETQPGKPGTDTKPPDKTPADKAIEAIAAAKTALDEAEKESKKVADATDTAKLADVQKAAKDAAAKAKIAKESATLAETEAGNAKKAATGEAIKTWDTAIPLLTAAKGAADTVATKMESEAEAVGKATKIADAKTAWKESAGLLKTANEKMNTAKEAVDKFKTTSTSEKGKTGLPAKAGDQGTKEKKTAGAFGVSVTAEYSKKFSLETKMHSEIKVTMVPYPPPTLFIDWVRDHFEQVKKERAEAESLAK